MTDSEELPTASTGDSINIDGILINSTVIIKSQVEGDAAGVAELKEILLDIQQAVASSSEAAEFEHTPPEPGHPPYLGLQYFDEKDSVHFFGREKLTARIVNRLRDERFLAIIGASGSGKSSLARAGVLPALKRGTALEDGTLPPSESSHWEYYLVTPGDHPLESLAAALLRGDPSPAAVSALAQEMRQNPRALVLKARQLLAQSGNRRVFLLIDQFEEVFSLCRDQIERRAFFDSLLEIANPLEDPPLGVLITLRSDFYDPVAGAEGLRQLVSQHQELIGPMDREELTRAVLFPAALGSWKIQQGLIQVMLDDVGDEPGNLPLLSHALLETWKRRRGRTMTLSGYTETGGVEGAIAQTAESVFRKQLSSQQQVVARLIFVRLAELGQDALDTRRRANFSELITRSTDEMSLEAVLDILSDARLVTTDVVQPGDLRVVQVAHEALIRGWPTLQAWLQENRSALIQQRELSNAAQDWQRHQRDPALLFRGSRLREAGSYTHLSPEMVSLEELDFLDASRQQETRQKTVQFGLVGLSMLLLAAIVAGVLWYQGVFSPPARMQGLYNIAVAPVTLAAAAGTGSTSAQAGGEQISAWLGAYLQDELADPNVWVWYDSPELKRKRVEIGPVAGGDQTAQAAAAQETAQRLGAQVMVFGSIDPMQHPAELTLQFWISPTLGYNYEDLQGNFQSGAPIRVLDPLNPGLEVQQALNDQAASIAHLALGLYHTQLGQAEQAAAEFEAGTQAAPRSAMAHFFLGREYLFLASRQETPTERESYQQAAQAAFQRSVCLDPGYARAYVGLGSLRLAAARQGLQAAGIATPPADINSLLLQAQMLYEQARKLASDEQAAANAEDLLGTGACAAVSQGDPAAGTYTNASIPVAGVAQNGLGAVLQLRGVAAMQSGLLDEAGQDLTAAVEVFESLIGLFKGTDQPRYLTQTYERLGNTLVSRATLAEMQSDYSAARVYFEQALLNYDLCIAQGQASPDLVVTQDIVEAVCRPNRIQVQTRLEQLFGEGGS